MHYRPRDRSPICDFSFWDETIGAWYDQGLPRSVNRANRTSYSGSATLSARRAEGRDWREFFTD